jgi:hypothetical protein
MSKEKTDVAISKEIQKLESVGKSGKTNKVISVSVKHLELVK